MGSKIEQLIVDHMVQETEVHSRVMTISPEMAAEMLARNHDNRPISKDVVRRYAEMMKAGKWQITNQGIGFCKNGHLKDGQHRLTAITIANVPVKMLVITGLENDTNMIDRGRLRSVTNVLQMAGVEKDLANRAVVSAANVLLKLTTGVNGAADMQIERLISKQPDLLKKAISAARQGAHSAVCKKAACHAAAFCAMYNGISEKKLNRFFEVANSGFAEADYESSAIVFRNYLLSHFSGLGSTKGEMLPTFMQCTRAIKDFCDSKPRRHPYTGDPVFFTSVKEYIKKEIL